MQLEEGDVVLCTVDRIVGTVVFAKIEGDGEGSIVFSEVAPGRIRNIRDYVVPKKKIVCKVLRVSPSGHIDLSFRRVTQKESKEVKERYEEERSYISMLKSILKEKAEEAVKKIGGASGIYDFFQNAKENPKELEKIAGKKEAGKILEILKAQKKKKASIKKEINLAAAGPKGLQDIKEILGAYKNADIRYISGGKYSVKTESNDIKSADNELRKIILEMEKKAKNKDVEFSIKEK
jgi:translation initiation factor 2 alpha subunit (eIF-2alpha)